MISTNLHKPSSAINREAFAFSFIPVIQAELMNLWERGSGETFESRQKQQEDLPRCCLMYQLFLDFLKKVLSVKEIYRLPKRHCSIFHLFWWATNILYKINKLTIPRDPDERLSFYINILECLERDYFPVWIHNKFLDSVLWRRNKQIWVLIYCRCFPV